MEWGYDYLLSCPGILVLGYFRYGELEGVATLAIQYPRISILGRNGEYRVVGDVPGFLQGKRIKRICYGLVEGREVFDDFLDEVVKYSMYMGGYNIFLNNGGKPLIIQSEIVDDKNVKIYYREASISIRGWRRSGLGEWVILGVGLREGRYEIVEKACSRIGVLRNNTCIINTPSLQLALSKKDPGAGYTRIHVDNNGLRNVIKVKQ